MSAQRSNVMTLNELFQQATWQPEEMSAWLHDQTLNNLWDVADQCGIDWESVGMYGMTKRQVVKALMAHKYPHDESE